MNAALDFLRNQPLALRSPSRTLEDIIETRKGVLQKVTFVHNRREMIFEFPDNSELELTYFYTADKKEYIHSQTKVL